MHDPACVTFLEWALPALSLRWPGFRHVRKQVCKRLFRRISELGLEDLAAYRAWIEAHPDEWPVLDAMCRVTISRFWRDAPVWEALRDEVVPTLCAVARENGGPLRVWSAGCASGEEPYTFALLWRLGLGDACTQVPLELLASDADAVLIERARRAEYDGGTLRELPETLRGLGFVDRNHGFRVREETAALVCFEVRDVRESLPQGPFDLVFCRNLAFTYFAPELQRSFLARLHHVLRPGGALVIGRKEDMVEPADGFGPWRPSLNVFRRL